MGRPPSGTVDRTAPGPGLDARSRRRPVRCLRFRTRTLIAGFRNTLSVRSTGKLFNSYAPAIPNPRRCQVKKVPLFDDESAACGVCDQDLQREIAQTRKCSVRLMSARGFFAVLSLTAPNPDLRTNVRTSSKGTL